MNKYLSWISLNILLPFAPFAVKAFVNYFGPSGKIDIFTLLDKDDILVFSFVLCIINLNINLNGKKNWFERSLRFFFQALVVLDCILLGLIYSNQKVSHTGLYNWIALCFPLIVGPIYKYNYQREEI
jgi:hypothetical protein